MLEMTAAPIRSASSEGFQRQFEISLDFIDTITSDWIRVPVGVNYVLITVIIDVGAAKIQTTNDTVENIENNTAYAEDWPYGIVTETTERWAKPPKAFRLVNITGSSKLLGSCQ